MNPQTQKQGQGLLEYLIICALVGIFCLAIVSQFGKVLHKRIEGMKKTVSSKISIP